MRKKTFLIISSSSCNVPAVEAAGGADKQQMVWMLNGIWLPDLFESSSCLCLSCNCSQAAELIRNNRKRILTLIINMTYCSVSE